MDSIKPIPLVQSGQSIRADTQNHIISAVNRLNSIPVSNGRDWEGNLGVPPQGTILPAVISATSVETAFSTGDVVVITDYLSKKDNTTVLTGGRKSFGVSVDKKTATTAKGRAIAVVVEPLANGRSGSVCIGGAALAKVNRVATSPTNGTDGGRLTGTVLPGNTYFELGIGVGEADIWWEESTASDIHLAYVQIPGGNQNSVSAVNSEGAVIPPYSVLESIGMSSDKRIQMRQPDTDNLSQIYVSPAYPIPIGSKFEALTAEDGLVATSAVVASGDGLGTKAGQWTMESGNTGFIATAGDSGGVARVRPFRVTTGPALYEQTLVTSTLTGSGGLESLGSLNAPATVTVNGAWFNILIDGKRPYDLSTRFFGDPLLFGPSLMTSDTSALTVGGAGGTSGIDWRIDVDYAGSENLEETTLTIDRYIQFQRTTGEDYIFKADSVTVWKGKILIDASAGIGTDMYTLTTPTSLFTYLSGSAPSSAPINRARFYYVLSAATNTEQASFTGTMLTADMNRDYADTNIYTSLELKNLSGTPNVSGTLLVGSGPVAKEYSSYSVSAGVYTFQLVTDYDPLSEGNLLEDSPAQVTPQITNFLFSASVTDSRGVLSFPSAFFGLI